MSENLTWKQTRDKLLSAGEQAANAQHQAGKLTARERIEKLFDDGSFLETNLFMKSAQLESETVITGYGTVEGRPAYVIAQDYTSLSGAMTAKAAEKAVKAYEAAVKVGAPIISLYDTAGADIREGMRALDGYARLYKASVDASGVVPQIALVMGPCPGAAAFAAELADFTIITEKNAYITGRGPQVLSAAEGKDMTGMEIGGGEAAQAKSALAQLLAADEDTAIGYAKLLLRLLPSNNLDDAPVDVTEDDLNREIASLNDYEVGATDMRTVLSSVADTGSYLELSAAYGCSMVTALASINGHSVGLIGNNAAFDGGEVSIAAANKAAYFVQFCDAFNIPVVLFADSKGLPVSLCQEQKGLARAGAGLIYAVAQANVAKVAVIAGCAVGSAYSLMASRALGLDMVYAWPNASICAMEPEALASILYEKEIAASEDPLAARTEYAAKAAMEQGALVAASEGLVDDVIEPALTRPVLASALELLWTKREALPARKHGVRPM